MKAQYSTGPSANTQWADYALPDIYQSSGWPQQAQPQGSRALGFLIWIPALATAIALIAFDQRIPAIVICGVALLVHSLFQPRVALYVLIFSIPLEWMVLVAENITTLSKLIGAYAMLLSVPRILTAAIPTNWDRSGKWIVFLILWAAVTVMWSPHPDRALIGVQSLALVWGIPLLMCVHVRDRQTLRLLMHVYLASCLVGVFAYVALSDVVTLAEGSERAAGAAFVGDETQSSSGNANIFARDFAAALIISFYLFITSRNNLRKAVYALCVTALGVGIILTKGRNVYLGVPFAMAGALVLLGGAGVLRRLILAGTMGIVVGTAGIVIIKLGLLGEGIVERFNSIFEKGFEAGSRATFWKEHIELFFGTGFLGRGYRQAAYLSETSYHVAHNDFISIAGMLGLVGVLCFALFYLTLVVRIRAMKDLWSKMFCLMLLCFMFFGGLTEDDYVIKYFAMSAGWLLCMIRLEENKRREHQASDLTYQRGGATLSSFVQ